MAVALLRNCGEVSIIGAYCYATGRNPVTGIALYALAKLSEDVIGAPHLLGRVGTLIAAVHFHDMLISFIGGSPQTMQGDHSLIRESDCTPLAFGADRPPIRAGAETPQADYTDTF